MTIPDDFIFPTFRRADPPRLVDANSITSIDWDDWERNRTSDYDYLKSLISGMGRVIDIIKKED